MGWSTVAEVLAILVPIVALPVFARTVWLLHKERISIDRVVRRCAEFLAVLLLGFIAVNSLTPDAREVIEAQEGSIAFAAFGDFPYDYGEDRKYRLVLKDVAEHSLDVVLHVGDILAGSCTEERFRDRRADFDALPHPLVYTPGDNEWTDCWRNSRHVFPLDRLDVLRSVFYDTPGMSLGGRPFEVVPQSLSPDRETYVENARWVLNDVVFATIHMVGSNNARASYPRRTAADDAEVEARTEAAVEWVHEAFDWAEAVGAGTVVLTFHGAPGWTESDRHLQKQAFAPFVAAMRDEAEAWERPVLAIHGDWHNYIVDQPLKDSAGDVLGNFTRLQVPGSPDIGWVHVTYTGDTANPFEFEPRVVPFWKFW